MEIGRPVRVGRDRPAGWAAPARPPAPARKAIFEKHLPEIVSNPQIDQGRALTLPEIVQYVPEIVTPAKLEAIDTELKALPPQ